MCVQPTHIMYMYQGIDTEYKAPSTNHPETAPTIKAEHYQSQYVFSLYEILCHSFKEYIIEPVGEKAIY